MDVTVTEVVTGKVLLSVRGVVDRRAVRSLSGRLDALLDPAAGSGVEVVIDLSAVSRCDCKLLAMLTRNERWSHVVRGGVVVRGLRAHALTGFAEAGLGEVVAVHRVSRALAGPSWPRESGAAGMAGLCGERERRVARFCADLFTAADTGAAAVATRLVTECVDLFGGHAVVVLPAPSASTPTSMSPSSAGPRWAVVCASGESARVVAAAGLSAGDGPVARCLRLGEPVSAPDLAEMAARWPRYVPEALRRGVAAVRALPLRDGTAPSESAPSGGPPSGSAAAAVVGALVVLRARPGPMAPVDLQVLEAFADLAGAALTRVGSRRAPTAHGATPGSATPARAGIEPGVAEDRVVIDRAAGVVAYRDRVSVAHAYGWLLDQARDRDLHLAEVARAVVEEQIDGRVGGPDGSAGVDAAAQGVEDPAQQP